MIDPLPDGCILEDGEEWQILTTPFLDPSFDRIQIYIQEKKDRYLLSDMGECETYLWSHGYSISKLPNIRKLIEKTIAHTGLANGEGDFGIQIATKSKDRNEFLKAYFTLITAILQIEQFVVFKSVYK